VNEILSAFDIINALVRKDEWLQERKVVVAYENDTTKIGAVIFVKDTIVRNKQAQFLIDIRGFKNNGRSTSNIVGELLKYDTYYMTLNIRDVLYDVRFLFDEVTGVGSDEHGRTSITAELSVNVDEK